MSEEKERQERDESRVDLDALLERGLQRVVEALVFAADAPIPAERIAEVYADVTGEAPPAAEDVLLAVTHLNAAYEETERTLRIERWGGGLRMATTAPMAPYLKALFTRERQASLSRSLMEALAIVAYRQPVTKPEVDFVRGVDSDYTLRKLMQLGLIDVVGRSDSLGRPLLYGTTRLFLDQFGINALEDLPNLREIEEILDDPAFNKERARLLQLEEETHGPEGHGGDRADGEVPSDATEGPTPHDGEERAEQDRA